MSTKTSILLTNDHEHWYHDCSEMLSNEPYRDAIVLEFDKKNIRIDVNDEDDLIITLINPDSKIYKIIDEMSKYLKK